MFRLILVLIGCSQVLGTAQDHTKAPAGIAVIVEYIEVEHQAFSDHLISHPLTDDATELRQQVQAWAKLGMAKIRETMIVRTISGESARIESVDEILYPTKYDFPKVPLVKLEKDDAGNPKPVDMALPILPAIPPTPTAFEMRKVGSILEVEAKLTKDGANIELGVAPQLVTLLPRRDWQSKMGDKQQVVATPTFHTANATTRVTMKNGSYAFLGTSRLPDSLREKALEDSIVLMFVRADAF